MLKVTNYSSTVGRSINVEGTVYDFKPLESKFFEDSLVSEIEDITDKIPDLDMVFIPSVVGTILVSKTGGNYTTLTSALISPEALAATAEDPLTINVANGVYLEDPFTIPDYVSVVGQGRGTVIQPISSVTGAYVTLTTDSRISQCYLQGNNFGDAGSIGILHNSIGLVEITNMFIDDFETGVKADGSGVSIRLDFTRVAQGIAADTLICYESTNSAILNISDCIASGGTTAKGVYANGGTVFLMGLRTFNCTDGILVDDSGLVRGSGIILTNSDKGLAIESIGNSVASLAAISVVNSGTWDVYSNSATARMTLVGLEYDSSKRSLIIGTHFEASTHDTRSDALRSSGEFIFEQKGDVGTPGQPAGLDVGEGGSYDTDKNGYANVAFFSFDASAASGSKFTQFTNNAGTQLTEVGDAVYACGINAFSATRFTITTAMVVGAGSIIAEHWDGATWVACSIATYAKDTLEHRANINFSNVETQYVEHTNTVYASWVADNNVLDEIPLLSEDMYCVRYRVVAAITSGMVFESGKLRGNDFDITAAGINVSWGKNRTSELELHEQGLFNAITSAPANNDIDLSANITLDGVANSFAGNVLDKLTTITSVPVWADTSTPVEVEISGFGTTTAVGNIDFEVIVVQHKNGDDINNNVLTELTGSKVTAYNGSADIGQKIIIPVNIETLSPGANLAILFQRDGSNGNLDDTYTGAFTIVSVGLLYTRKLVS